MPYKLFNRPVALLYFLIFFSSVSWAQVKVIEVSHYIFPEFSKGVVLMKNGVKNEAMLNFNSLTEEMIFDNKGTKLAMTQLDQVDTVYVKDRKFFILNNKFVEVIFKSKVALYAEHRCSVKDPGKPAAYGGTSQTSATTTYSSFLSGGQVYELKLPDGIVTKPYIEYWFGKDGKVNKFLTVRQLLKLCGDKEEAAKAYAKENNVKYENQESIIGLIRYLDGN